MIRPNRKRKAFTLIELLIVIAIIAILSAIAIPNFMEAQTRAKVSRALADMRAFSTAIEAYAVDYGAYPRGRESGPVPDNITPLSRRLIGITTPIAYITALTPDVFQPVRGSDGLDQWDIDTYDYYDTESDWEEDKRNPDSTRGAFWRLASGGPDLFAAFGILRQPGDPQYNPNEPSGVAYDPTNGTLSEGDIFRLGPVHHEYVGP